MAHNKWTETEIQMLKDNYKTMTDDELSELISNHSKTSIVTQRRRLGLTRDLSITPFDKVCEVIDNYGYKLLSDESDYINGGSLIRFWCNRHGEQILQASRLMNGRYCKECSKERVSKKTYKVANDRDIDDCNNKNLTYVETNREMIDGTSRIMVSFICNIHKDKGIQTLLRGNLHNSKKPCKYCNHRNLTQIELMDLINDCKLDCVEVLSENIKNIKSRVECMCTIHNEKYETLVESVINGRGCNKCSIEKSRNYLTFLEAQEKLKRNKPDIELISYEQCSKPITVRCTNCGELWQTNIQEPSRCPNCDNKFIGESLVYQYLKSHNISFIHQHKFEDCFDINQLVFDFYLPELNTCIEYNGKQHYMPIDRFGGEERFLTQVKHDEIKREYCKRNNINLIEIKYTIKSYKKIEECLNNAI